ncbi:MAG: hypothetical protein ACI4OL_08615 [Gemmiger sp.]
MAQYIWLFWLILLVLLAAAVAYGLYLSNKEPAHPATSRETLTEHTDASFDGEGDVHLTSIPSDEIMIPERYFLVNNTNAQVEYLIVPGHLVTLRVASHGSLLIPQAYLDAEYAETADYDVMGTTVTQKASPAQKVLITWTKEEFDYALYSELPEMNLMGGIIDEFVTQTNAEMT